MESIKQITEEKLDRINYTRKWAHGEWMKKNSKVYAKAMEMSDETFKDGALSRKQKEFIALGISVITNCESCMQWHIEQALELGATEKEIIEAIEVAIEMGTVPATVHARFALEVLNNAASGSSESAR
jgi:AhpD family alkylhydroperoxidase